MLVRLIRVVNGLVYSGKMFCCIDKKHVNFGRQLFLHLSHSAHSVHRGDFFLCLFQIILSRLLVKQAVLGYVVSPSGALGQAY